MEKAFELTCDQERVALLFNPNSGRANAAWRRSQNGTPLMLMAGMGWDAKLIRGRRRHSSLITHYLPSPPPSPALPTSPAPRPSPPQIVPLPVARGRTRH